MQSYKEVADDPFNVERTIGFASITYGYIGSDHWSECFCHWLGNQSSAWWWTTATGWC